MLTWLTFVSLVLCFANLGYFVLCASFPFCCMATTIYHLDLLCYQCQTSLLLRALVNCVNWGRSCACVRYSNQQSVINIVYNTKLPECWQPVRCNKLKSLALVSYDPQRVQCFWNRFYCRQMVDRFWQAVNPS